MVGLRLDLLPLAREGGVGGSAVAGSWAPGVLVCLRAACCVFAGSMRLTALVISSGDVAVVALSVWLCWSIWGLPRSVLALVTLVSLM